MVKNEENSVKGTILDIAENRNVQNIKWFPFFSHFKTVIVKMLQGYYGIIDSRSVHSFCCGGGVEGYFHINISMMLLLLYWL